MNRINRPGRTLFVFLAALLLTSIASAQSAPDRQSSNNNPSFPAINVDVVNTPTVNVGSLPAVALGPSQVTNMGQRPSNQVVLANNSNQIGCPQWYRIGPDGNPSAFTIPSGQYLVITDMEFIAFQGANTPGVYEGLGLLLGSANETVLAGYAISDPLGTVATTQHITSGIVMSVLPTCFSPTANNTIQQVVLRGYLIPAS